MGAAYGYKMLWIPFYSYLLGMFMLTLGTKFAVHSKLDVDVYKRQAVGWQSIGEKWYYLNPAEPVPVPATDPVTGQTVQSTEGQLPYGAMYQNRKTPDGFMTGADGAWME